MSKFATSYYTRYTFWYDIYKQISICATLDNGSCIWLINWPYGLSALMTLAPEPKRSILQFSYHNVYTVQPAYCSPGLRLFRRSFDSTSAE